MTKCSLNQIVKAVPDVQTITLPDNWFDFADYETKKPIFIQIYEWMLKKNYISNEDYSNIHNKIYAGDRIYKKVIRAERKRIKKTIKVKSSKLDDYVGWSDVNCGMQTLMLSRFELAGESFLFIPDKSKDVFNKFIFKLVVEEQQRNIRKSKDKASGKNFFLWLISQTDRPDHVGDLARYALDDISFPKNADTYFEIYSYFDNIALYNNSFSNCIDDAWKEYINQYPERIIKSTQCSVCYSCIDAKDSILAINQFIDEIFVMCKDCYDVDDEEIIIIKDDLSDIDYLFIENIQEQYKIHEFVLDRFVNNLKLWGFIPDKINGTVYFILDTYKKDIKIGFTSKHIKERLSALQTSSSSELKVLATIPADRAYEKELHRKFNKFKVNGEWFSPSPDLVSYIDTLK